jgi:hypothetical protein
LLKVQLSYILKLKRWATAEYICFYFAIGVQGGGSILERAQSSKKIGDRPINIMAPSPKKIEKKWKPAHE